MRTNVRTVEAQARFSHRSRQARFHILRDQNSQPRLCWPSRETTSPGKSPVEIALHYYTD